MGSRSSKLAHRCYSTAKQYSYGGLSSTSRTVSLPVIDLQLEQGQQQQGHTVRLTSSSYGRIRFERQRSSPLRSFLNRKEEEELEEEEDDDDGDDDGMINIMAMDAKEILARVKQKKLPILEEPLMVINTQELMEGLEEIDAAAVAVLGSEDSIEKMEKLKKVKMEKGKENNNSCCDGRKSGRLAALRPPRLRNEKGLRWLLENSADLNFVEEEEEEEEEEESPFFDPSLAAVFEKALEDSVVGTIPMSISSPSSSSSNLSSLWTTHSELSSPATHSVAAIATSDTSSDEACVDGFELKCPPGGENSAVLYFTSMRGVRKTYEDCCNARLILKGTGFHIDERDVWLHQAFRTELLDTLGENSNTKSTPLPLPTLFIKGRHIGGAQEVKQLHEQGTLSTLLQGLPTQTPKEDPCNGCDGFRFTPCLTCNGSRKLIFDDGSISWCSDCNENGLMWCPICS